MPQHVYTIEVGNSRIKACAFEVSSLCDPEPHSNAAQPVAVQPVWNVSQGLDQQFPDGELLQRIESDGAVVGLAGSQLTVVSHILQHWPAGWPAAEFVSKPAQIPIETALPAPVTVGLDRLLNALAATARCTPHQPAVIVDTGTATTVDVVTADGCFRGGAILPGLGLSAQALHDGTDALPLVELPAEIVPLYPADTTRQAILTGLYEAQAGGVQRLVDRAQRFLADQDPLYLLTGGDAQRMASELTAFLPVPHLTSEGLARVVLKRCGRGE